MRLLESDVRRGLSALADDVDPGTVARVEARASEQARRRRGPPRVSALAAGVAAALIGIAVLTLSGLGQDSTVAPAAKPPVGYAGVIGSDDFQQLPVKSGEPCYNAQAMDLPSLAGIVTAPIWLPDTDLASAANLENAWNCAGEPVLTFEHVTISFEDGWDVPDPAQRWEEHAKFWDMGHVDTVLGRPAYVAPVGERMPTGQVLVVVEETLIRVQGDGSITTDQLVAVADSINVDVPLVG